MDGINVVSLFDGASMGHVALDLAGVRVNKYYASEIDKWAKKITQKNYPGTIQIGDVTKLRLVPKGFPKIDLVMGGSPCQGFSFAGKQLNFEDPRSRLFFDFVRVYKMLKKKNQEIKFLLENVRMKKEYQKIISDILEVEPIEINSSLVSAQNRRRLYWTNIKGFKQPKDKEIYLRDILQNDDEVDSKYIITGKWLEWFKKNGDERLRKKYMSLNPIKAITMTARQYASWNGNFVVFGASRGRYKINGVRQDSKMLTAGLTSQELECRNDGKTNALATVGKDNLVVKLSDILEEFQVRRLTPIECERLQNLPDNYTEGVSDSQRYKILGNGWTAQAVAEILKHVHA